MPILTVETLIDGEWRQLSIDKNFDCDRWENLKRRYGGDVSGYLTTVFEPGRKTETRLIRGDCSEDVTVRTTIKW